VVVAVLLIAGDQMPVMPFLDIVGNVKEPPLHTGAIGSNAGWIVAGHPQLLTVMVVSARLVQVLVVVKLKSSIAKSFPATDVFRLYIQISAVVADPEFHENDRGSQEQVAEGAGAGSRDAPFINT
jgi:hypothetical protein